MDKIADRPVRKVPSELTALVAAVRDVFSPADLWLFGSRARGDFREGSDWDLLVVLPDHASDDLTDPVATWEVARQSRVPVTLLATKLHDLHDIWGAPNTLGYDLSREGVRLVD